MQYFLNDNKSYLEFMGKKHFATVPLLAKDSYNSITTEILSWLASSQTLERTRKSETQAISSQHIIIAAVNNHKQYITDLCSSDITLYFLRRQCRT